MTATLFTCTWDSMPRGGVNWSKLSFLHVCDVQCKILMSSWVALSFLLHVTCAACYGSNHASISQFEKAVGFGGYILHITSILCLQHCSKAAEDRDKKPKHGSGIYDFGFSTWYFQVVVWSEKFRLMNRYWWWKLISLKSLLVSSRHCKTSSSVCLFQIHSVFCKNSRCI